MYFALFVLNTCMIAGVYIFANEKHIPLYPVYFAIALVSVCVYITLFLHHNNEIGKAHMNGKSIPEEILQKRRNRLKTFIVIFAPFVLTVLCDSIYLLLLADNPLFEKIVNLLK